jgi:hypothetical protein
LGQRVEQVSQEAQYQMDRPARMRCHWPNCSNRTTRLGGCSIKVAIGQPAEHLPHWKQRRTEVPERASTLRTKSTSIVSWEMIIFFFFTLSVPIPLFQSGFSKIKSKSCAMFVTGLFNYI